MRWLLLVFLVAGCDSTTPAVARWNSARLEVGGMTFGVHWNDTAAEAHRVSRHAFPKREAVFLRARAAIEAASGCDVVELGGDPAIVTARLSCAGKAPPPVLSLGNCRKAGGAVECAVAVR